MVQEKGKFVQSLIETKFLEQLQNALNGNSLWKKKPSTCAGENVTEMPASAFSYQKSTFYFVLI